MLPTHTVKAGHVLNGRWRIFGKVKVYHNWEKVKVFIESVDRFVWERCCESWRNKGFLVCLPPAHQSKQGQKHQKTMIFGKRGGHSNPIFFAKSGAFEIDRKSNHLKPSSTTNIDLVWSFFKGAREK